MARQRIQSDDERRERLKAKLEETLAESKQLRSNVADAIDSRADQSGRSRGSSKQAA